MGSKAYQWLSRQLPVLERVEQFGKPIEGALNLRLRLTAVFSNGGEHSLGDPGEACPIGVIPMLMQGAKRHLTQ